MYMVVYWESASSIYPGYIDVFRPNHWDNKYNLMYSDVYWWMFIHRVIKKPYAGGQSFVTHWSSTAGKI